jgi:hypothetical protein
MEFRPPPRWAFVVESRRDPTLLRFFWWAPGESRPALLWVRTAKFDGRWIVVGVGRDASWKSARYSADFEVFRRLGYRTLARFGSLKPAIYLYPPREERVDVRLGYRGQVTSTSPVIDPTLRGWQVDARPDGTLVDTVGRRWPYLFWEGLGSPQFDLSRGSVVRGRDVDAFLRRALAERGLSPAENAAFRAYWLSRLSASPWVLLSFQGAAWEEYAPLEVTPKPDVSIRVYLVAKPLSVPIAVPPQHLAPPPNRRGFTLVEWGGTLMAP